MFAQARLPYTIAQNVVNAASFVSNAVGSYCLQSGAPTPCNPTISDLQNAGYLSNSNISNGTYTLPDNTTLTLGNYGPAGNYGMEIGLKNSLLSSNSNYENIVMNRIPGSFKQTNGSTNIHVSQPLPAIASLEQNLSSKYVQINPTNQQSGDANISGNLNTPAWVVSGATNTGYIYTNHQSINSGSIYTNGQPINTGGIYTNGQQVNAGRVNSQLGGWTCCATSQNYAWVPEWPAGIVQPNGCGGCNVVSWGTGLMVNGNELITTTSRIYSGNCNYQGGGYVIWNIPAQCGYSNPLGD